MNNRKLLSISWKSKTVFLFFVVLLTCILCAAAGIMLCSDSSQTINADGEVISSHNHEEDSGWNVLNLEIESELSTGYYYLDDSCESEYAYISINAGASVTLCLNGKSLMYDSADTKKSVIYINEDATLTLYDCAGDGSISGGNAIYGAGVYVDEGATFTMSGGSISNNEATTSYSASSNISSNYGGGVYVASSATFNMSGGTISNNKATFISSSWSRPSYGGGVYVASSATFNMSGGSILNNEAGSSDTDITNSGYGAGVYVASSATFNMSGGSISKNIANSKSSGPFGAGVYVDEGATFTMSDGTISDNEVPHVSSLNRGGGVCVYSDATFNMSGGTISGNKSCYDSGVYVYSGATFNMSGGTISNSRLNGSDTHTCSGSARGVYVASSATFNMSGGTISNNTAGTNGGGVYVQQGTFNMSGGTISGNTASRYGGGVYVTIGATFTMYGGTISNNVACSTTSNNEGSGGGVYVYNSYNSYSATFTMYGGTISGNRAISTYQNSYSYGGGVYVATDSGKGSSTFTMYGGVISGNEAISDYYYSYGGGVYVRDGATFDMSGGTISGNTADYGGGVYVRGLSVSTTFTTTFNMSGGTISNNTAGTDGGGVNLSGAGSSTPVMFDMSGGIISGNTASRYGGGVYISTNFVTFSISGSPIIIGNIASDGALNNVYLYTGTLTIKSDLTSSALIGVCIPSNVQTGPPRYYGRAITSGFADNNGDSSRFSCFISDQGFTVAVKDDEVYICGDHVYDSNRIDTGEEYYYEYYNEYYHYKTCSYCGTIGNEGAHSYSGYTGTQDEHYLKCSDCEYQTSLGEHKYDSDYYASNSSHHWNVCIICGHECNTAEHSGGTATYATLAVCETCGVPYGELSDSHDFDDDGVCTICGSYHSDGTDSSDSGDGGDSESSNNCDHIWGNEWHFNVGEHLKVCTECDATGEYGEHNFDDNNICTVCNFGYSGSYSDGSILSGGGDDFVNHEHTGEWSPDDAYTHSRTCEECAYAETADHTFDDNNICTACGYEYGSAVGGTVDEDGNILKLLQILLLAAMFAELCVIAVFVFKKRPNGKAAEA